MAGRSAAVEYAARLRANLDDLRRGRVTPRESGAVAAAVRAEIQDRRLVRDVVAWLMSQDLANGAACFLEEGSAVTLATRNPLGRGMPRADRLRFWH